MAIDTRDQEDPGDNEPETKFEPDDKAKHVRRRIDDIEDAAALEDEMRAGEFWFGRDAP